jgi:hypothetical protein
MSINEATPDMWNALREKYGAMASDELKYDNRDRILRVPVSR